VAPAVTGPPQRVPDAPLSTDSHSPDADLPEAVDTVAMDITHTRSDTTVGALAEPRRTWRVPDDRRLPALEACAHAVERTPPVMVRETLWDTAERALAFAGTELLRQEGARAWSIDRGDGPVPLPSGAGEGPPRGAVEALLHGQPLQVVRVRVTSTSLVVLRDRDGRVRAEVADVRVDEGDPDTTLLRSARWWALSDDGDAGSVSRSVERALIDAADDPGRGPDDAVPRLAPVRRPVTDSS
jgi:hypothetical protein